MHRTTPVLKDLVLVGGGHAHVSVLKRFGMKPLPGLRLTLITRDIHTPYSGMVPGYLSGHYDYDDCHIDLGPLAQFAGARLYHAEANGIDIDKQQVLVSGRPPVSYDLLSINIGSRPSSVHVPGVDRYAIAAKPIDIFLHHWESLVDRVCSSQGRFRIVVVGGGAGGVELALSTQYRLRELLDRSGDDPERLSYCLLTDSDSIMFQHNKGVRKRLQRIFNERQISFQTQSRVTEIQSGRVMLSDGTVIEANAVFWVTTAGAPSWLENCGLSVDRDGFVRVNQQLQTLSHDNIFAAGDIASLPDQRPKSGVFAVRQGPVLEHNLRATLTAKPMRRYRAQKNFLGLISTGDRYAVASRGNWSLEGGWLWKLKDWIDVRFMKNFNQLPEMAQPETSTSKLEIDDAATRQELLTNPVRCGGCGAKVGATILSRVIQRLPVQYAEDVLIGLGEPDDCALLSVPTGKRLVQSVDYFRAFIQDAYTFGAIATNHALGDLYAMGAEPQSALAIATVPFATEKVVEETLYELMAGALSLLEPSGAVLAGGHSSEGVELGFGLTVNGLVDPERVLLKSGLQPDDALILTKAVGTGTLMAAQMRGKAKGRWVDAAIQSMLVSSQQAAQCLGRHQVTACTDLTGFGLVGHLLEMLQASGVEAELFMGALPVLDGAVDTARAGILSTLQPQNLRLRRALSDIDSAAKHPVYPLLFDPQTAGGLLAGVPQKNVESCMDELRALGYTDSRVLGRVKASVGEQTAISLIGA